MANNKKLGKNVRISREAKVPMGPGRWKILIQNVTNGATRSEACKAAGVTVATYKAYLITESKAPAELKAADMAWIRRDWPRERIDEFLTMVAEGNTNIDAGKKLNYMDGELSQLMNIIMHDPGVRELYNDARQLQAESWADQIIQISDDGSNDTYEAISKTGKVYTKVDHDVINRSKLRIDTRKWIMARLHHERFGDRLQQTIDGNLNVNHSEILDVARKRRERGEDNKLKLVGEAPGLVSEDTPEAADG